MLKSETNMAAVEAVHPPNIHRRSNDSIRSNKKSKETVVFSTNGKHKMTRKTSVLSQPIQIVAADDGNDDINADLDQLSIHSNPFKVPADQDIFMLRDKERNKKKKNRESELSLPVWEKHTYSSRINKGTAATRKSALQIQPDDDTVDGDDKDDASWTLNVTRCDRNPDREDLTEYVNKKREMFLVQYSLRVKKDEMKKLEDLALAEEQKLERAEQYLEEDATMFDEFLKENDRNSVEAIKIAEAETKAKLEKVMEIKKSHSVLMSVKSEISKYEEILKEYLLYKTFLEKLSPQEWKEAKLKKAKLRAIAKKEEARSSRTRTPQTPQNQRKSPVSAISSVLVTKKTSSALSNRRGNIRPTSKRSTATIRSTASNRGSALKSRGGTTDTDSVRSSETGVSSTVEEDSDDEPELFFTDPQQLLNIFLELEEDNLSLITNSQETEEAMEEIKHSLKITKKKMNRQTEQLKSQIDVLKSTIDREEEKADMLEIKCKMFNFGEFKAADEDQALNRLNKKVEDVYRQCIGDNEANINSLQMLTSIENQLEELFECIERMPPKLVEAAEKAKEKERRMRMREEKILQQKLHQEERVRKALERAKADPKRKLGKRLIFRSEPPQRKQKDNKKKDGDNKKEEEELYFFT